MSTEVIVALDYPGADPARELVARLPAGTWYKVGMELFTAAGPRFVRELVAAGHPVFLDLKLHDIPNTVAGAVRAAGGLGVRLLTVHATGGREMITAAAEAAQTGSSGLVILAVTVLTSLDREALAEVTGADEGVDAAVLRRARLAVEAGAGGMVASVAECRELRAALGPGPAIATPGIRLPGDAAHDQKRVARPRDAAAAGADYLVVGRSITGADDPAGALRRVREDAVRA